MAFFNCQIANFIVHYRCLSLKSNRVILEADYLYKVVFMTYTCKVTVLDKKLYPELQEQYCANPQSGKCPCFNVGDEFIFERNDQKDDFWHCGAGTLIKSGKEESQSATPPGTAHCGSDGVPFCSEAWDAISRYIYAALQGGSIMKNWMKNENEMIACCSDGTRPVIFKIERIDEK